MKLRITNSSETFDVENRLGRALLLIGNGQLVEVQPPVVVIDTTLRWQLFGEPGSEKALCLKVECPCCHLGMTMERVVAFRHCRGRVDYPPEPMAEAFTKLLLARKPSERPAPPTNAGMTAFI